MEANQRVALLESAYRLFDQRDIDGLFALMSEDVEWPDVPNGRVLHGKDAIRPYWEGQFSAGDPRVTPTEILAAGDDLVAVVDQRLYDREGRLLRPPSVVYHRYSFEGDLVRRMVVFTDRAAALG